MLKLHFHIFFQLTVWRNFWNFTTTDTTKHQFSCNLQEYTRNPFNMEVNSPDSEHFLSNNFLGTGRFYKVLNHSKVRTFLVWNTFCCHNAVKPKRNSFDNTFLFTITRHTTIVINADIPLKTCSKPPSEPAKRWSVDDENQQISANFLISNII